jgi:hypothetical protein
MPPRRKSTVQQVSAPVTRQLRISKSNAQQTILSAINPPNLNPDSVNNPPNPPPIRVDAPTPPTYRGPDAIDRLSTILQTGFENVGIQIRQASTSTFDQLMERLDGLSGISAPTPANAGGLSGLSGPTPANAGGMSGLSGTFPPTPTISGGLSGVSPVLGGMTSSGTSLPLAASSSLNVLSRWSWVTDQNVIASIANGNFDINQLPKLHREEDFRNRHGKATAEGVFNPFDKSKPSEVLMGQTKMHQVFKDLPTFFSAWQVYTSIRSTYSPERAPGLALFSERIFFHFQLNYPWYKILNYILAFFRKHQNSPPDMWNDVDGVLVANHLAVSQQKPEAVVTTPSTTGKSNKSSDPSISQQICRNWNRMEIGCKNLDCQRRHICAICEKDGHRAFHCPSNSI